MRFAFTEDQLAVRDAIRDLLVKECSPEVVRSGWPEPEAPGQGGGEGARAEAGAIAELWDRLVEMGVPGLLVPEASGGMGFDEVAAVLLLEEVGAVAAPLPVVETVAGVAPVLAAAGLEEELAGVLAGARLSMVDPFQALAPWSTEGSRALQIATRAQPGAAGSLVATGDLTFEAFFVELAATVEETVDGSLAARRVADEGSRVALDVDAHLLEEACNRVTLGVAAELLGLARRMLEMTVEYVAERKQFGVPVGSFQAIKHHLADARMQLEFAAPAVYRAAWSLSTSSPDVSRDVSMAKAMANETAHLVGRKALQCHGGIGYTVEYDLHLYLKRAWALERSWGDTAWHRARVAHAIGV